MDKFYKLLEWLDSAQALDYLQSLTKLPLGYRDLLALCDQWFCDACINCSGLYADVPSESDDIICNGYCSLSFPAEIQVPSIDGSGVPLLAVSGWQSVYGVAHRHKADGSVFEEQAQRWHVWIGDAISGEKVVFKPAQIKAMAAKINGEEEELKRLRQSLEDEKAKREAAELEVEKLRENIGFLYQDLREDREELEELRQRNTDDKGSTLLAVAGMLDLLLLDVNRPRYTQTTIAQALEAKGWRGTSQSGISKLFAKAKAAAKDADSDTQAKAEAMQSLIPDKF